MELLMQEIYPDFEAVRYGHMGDGNLHMNIIGPAGPDTPGFEARCHEISEQTYALTQSLGRSISANCCARPVEPDRLSRDS
jgi:FAD/FMN-containing dehydrogenase